MPDDHAPSKLIFGLLDSLEFAARTAGLARASTERGRIVYQ